MTDDILILSPEEYDGIQEMVDAGVAPSAVQAFWTPFVEKGWIIREEEKA